MVINLDFHTRKIKTPKNFRLYIIYKSLQAPEHVSIKKSDHDPIRDG